jgi:uncharacterized protein (DUF427 family)
MLQAPPTALDFAAHIFSALPELRVYPEAKRIRAFVAGEPVIDTTRAMVVWEPRRIVPSFAVPVDDLRASLVAVAGETAAEEHPVQVGDGPPVLTPGTSFAAHSTDGQAHDVEIPGAGRLPGAAFSPADPDLDGYVIVDFAAFDEWREEDELLVGHARDPFSTIDTRRSSRRVVVALDGVVLADSARATMLFETHLPVRYYLPRDDVRMDLLRPTSFHTTCPFKGEASYWSADVGGQTHDGIVWAYETPIPAAADIAGYLSFYPDRAEVLVDGALLAA